MDVRDKPQGAGKLRLCGWENSSPQVDLGILGLNKAAHVAELESSHPGPADIVKIRLKPEIQRLLKKIFLTINLRKARFGANRCSVLGGR